MKAIIDNLEEVLRQEIVLHASLLEEAEQKRSAVIKGDLPELEAILQREQALIAHVAEAEARRQELVEQARAALHITEEPLKMSVLTTYLAKALGDTAIKPLRQAGDGLKKILEQLRYRNRQNEELLKASIEHVNSFLKMVSQTSGTQTYDRKGQNSGTLRLFDRTA